MVTLPSKEYFFFSLPHYTQARPPLEVKLNLTPDLTQIAC